MEEKGGVLHIIFIFIGVACLSLGAFEFFTDEKIELKEDPNYSNTEKDNDTKNDNKDLISQINIVKNIDTDITLKDGNNVKVKFYLDEETSKGSFTYDGKTSFETNELELCDKYYLYNNTIISYCVYGSATSGHLYIIDNKGDATKVSNFKYQDYDLIPEDITLKDGKIIVNGLRVLEGAMLRVDNKEISLCNEDEIKENNISTDSIASGEFEITAKNDEVEFNLVKVTKTIQEFINESCKNVE